MIYYTDRMVRMCIALTGCCVGVLLSLTPLASKTVSWPPSPVRTFSGIVSSIDHSRSLIFIESNGVTLQIKYNAETLFSEVTIHTGSTPNGALALKSSSHTIVPGALIFTRVAGSSVSFFSSRVTTLSIK